MAEATSHAPHSASPPEGTCLGLGLGVGLGLGLGLGVGVANPNLGRRDRREGHRHDRGRRELVRGQPRVAQPAREAAQLPPHDCVLLAALRAHLQQQLQHLLPGGLEHLAWFG